MDDDVQTLIKKIVNEKRGHKFSVYIDFIQFPEYRAFEKHSRISFGFPLTVLVGQNGSGKTSLLYALHGAPDYQHAGNYWFGTPLDPIDLSDSSITIDRSVIARKRTALSKVNKGAFWYGYFKDGKARQVLKMRVRKTEDPDYWEPSRPVQSHQMEQFKETGIIDGKQGRDRWPAIKMKVLYLNFKTLMSAFDRCFYGPTEAVLTKFAKSGPWRKIVALGRKTGPRIQDYLRHRSKDLRRVLVDGDYVTAGGTLMHKPVVKLTDAELKDVSEIVGREYQRGCIVCHRFYEHWGISVLFRTNHRTYSEAFAGSGEAAVVRLVHDIHAAEDGTLVLLDEPETSLHPGAQERLLKFLLKMILAKHLQVVVSTHSPSLIRNLPKEAIKILYLSDNGSVMFTENVEPDEAFFHIGHPLEGKIEVIVEDRLAQTLVSAILQEIGGLLASKLLVRFGPGGATEMVKHAAVFMSREKNNSYFLFDGDQNRGKFDVYAIPIKSSTKDLDAQIKSKFEFEVKFPEDSNKNDAERRELRIKFLEYSNKYFKYFSFNSPEEEIWNSEIAETLLGLFISKEAERSRIKTQLEAESDAKTRFELLTSALLPAGVDARGQQIQTFHNMFVKRVVETKSSCFQAVKNLLEEIAENARMC